MSEEETGEALGTEEAGDDDVVQHPGYDGKDFDDDTDAGEDEFDEEGGA